MRKQVDLLMSAVAVSGAVESVRRLWRALGRPCVDTPGALRGARVDRESLGPAPVVVTLSRR